MGQTADQLRQEIEHKREDAAAKIDQLETRVQEIPQMARDTVTETVQQAKGAVTETVQQVKQSVDLRQQVEQRPLVALGSAVLGGFLLGGLLGGGKDGGRRGGGQHAGMAGGGAAGGLRGAAQRSGLDDTLATMSGALLGVLAERLRSMVDESFPEFGGRLRRQSDQGGPPSRGGGATGSASPSGGSAGLSGSTGTGSASPAVTDTAGRPTPYFSGESSGPGVTG